MIWKHDAEEGRKYLLLLHKKGNGLQLMTRPYQDGIFAQVTKISCAERLLLLLLLFSVHICIFGYSCVPFHGKKKKAHVCVGIITGTSFPGFVHVEAF